VALMSDNKVGADPFAVGRVVSRGYEFTPENIAAYADMAGDPNPLHHDAEFAERSRFGGIIASAAHSTGVLVSVLADKFSKNGESVGLGFSFTLRRGVKAGASTDLEWTITGRYFSEKLRGIVVELNGQLRDRETGQAYVLGEGRLLLVGETEIAAVAKQPLETRSS
jgi:3-hydroxybutyryl-CoA dehydratase